jgi:hypothetical protein
MIFHICDIATRANISFAVNKVSHFMSKASGSIALDGCKTHHEVFEGDLRLQIMPWIEGYCLERFL